MSKAADSSGTLARRAQTVRLAAAAYDESKHKRDATGKFAAKSDSDNDKALKRQRPEGWVANCNKPGFARQHPDWCRGGDTADVLSDEEWAAAEQKAGMAPKPTAGERKAKVEAAKKRQDDIKAGKAKAAESARKVGRGGK